MKSINLTKFFLHPKSPEMFIRKDGRLIARLTLTCETDHGKGEKNISSGLLLEYGIGMLLEGVRHVNALRMFHLFTRVSHVSPNSGTCRGLWFGFFLVGFCFFFPLVWFVLQVPETF